MMRILWIVCLLLFLAACTPVDLNAPVPSFDTGVDPGAWVTIPTGSFFSGQEATSIMIDYDYQIMVTDVTVAQYVAFLNQALTDGKIKLDGGKIVGVYPGDVFHAVKHEVRIDPGNYILIPLSNPASHYLFNGTTFTARSGWENHPMTNVSWFGAWTYCGYYSAHLPTELEWEKAARGSQDDRPFPWGNEIARNNANYYTSRDPFENMSSFGSRTTPVGFYNGKAYDGYATVSSASPYGLFDMAGNVWQWTGNVYPGQSDRILHGGSKDSYDMDLRVWVRNSAIPTYFSPDVGFRCVRNP